MNPDKSTKRNHGLTIVELATVMLIISMAGVGLVGSIISIVGFYQDDMVAKDIRKYGNAAMNKIVDKISDAARIDKRTGPNGFPLLTLYYPEDLTDANTLQVTSQGGFYWNGQPLLKNISLQTEGIYRDKEQREITLLPAPDGYSVRNMVEANYEAYGVGPGLDVVKKSVYEVTIRYALLTRYPDGESTEYFTFKRKVYSPQSLVYKKTQAGGSTNNSTGTGGPIS